MILPMEDLEASRVTTVRDDAFAELLLRALSRPEVREALINQGAGGN